MNKRFKSASLILAGILHIAPIAGRVASQISPALARSPFAIVMTWMIRVAAVAGAYHTVSAASAVLASSTTVSGTQGTRLSYQIRINDGENRVPQSWRINGTLYSNLGNTTNGMPPGLSLSLATGIISGAPTSAGSFPVTITAYENPGGGGAALTFTITFNIAALTQPTRITNQPPSLTLHLGEPLSLTVGASGTAPFTFKWQKDGVEIAGANAATYTVSALRTIDAGSYVAFVTGAGGTTNSLPAIITAVPLSIQLQSRTSQSATFLLQTIPGRHYILQSTPSLLAPTWVSAAEVTAAAGTSSLTDSFIAPSNRFWRYYPSP